MGSTLSDQDEEATPNPQIILQGLLEQAQLQTRLLSEIQIGVELDACLLDKIGRIVCMIANESHEQTKQLKGMREASGSFLEMYKAVHPEQALQLEKFDKMRAELQKCCPPDDKPELICHYEPCERGGGISRGDGYSMKSKGFLCPVPFDDRPHKPWHIEPDTLNDNEAMPRVPQGPIVGQLVPSNFTPNILDFRSGTAPSGSQDPVSFRTFTNSGITTNLWPPDMSGAKGADVVLMSGNLWLKLSVDSGKTFTNLDFTTIFAKETTYGGWAGDQVVHYVPAIDCFVLYVQSKVGTGANGSKSVVKVAFASPDDLKKFKGGKAAWWRQWDFTSDNFGLNYWLDFPDVSYGNAFLYINTNAFARTADSKGNPVDTFQGKLFFELPLKEIKAGSGFTYQYAMINEQLTFGSPTQNIGDENYWAAHIDNATMRIYSSKGTDSNYSWRERKLAANWPTASNSGKVAPEDLEDNIIGTAPDSSDWISEDHRIIGSTLVGTQLWFAWTAASGNGGGGGFTFPQPHIQLAKFDVAQDYKFLEQSQVWNADNAFAYPCLTTNSDNEVGISLAWGGGKSAFGSHAVGILGDFVVWFGEASDLTSTLVNPTRFGDFLHVRLAHPDTRFYSAFGYAVKKDATSTPPEKADYLYVEFGREKLAPPPVK
jgi:hypothetical protein